MIERCLDYRRVKRLSDWNVVVSQDFYYLVERENGIDLGMWCVHPWRDGALGHVSMGKDCRGRKAVESGKNALKWLFENTEFDKIYAVSPNEIRAAQLVAARVGMECIGADEENRYYLALRN